MAHHAVYEPQRPEAGASLPDMDRDRTLERTDRNVTKSARLLGPSRGMLYKIEKLGLSRPDKRQW